MIKNYCLYNLRHEADVQESHTAQLVGPEEDSENESQGASDANTFWKYSRCHWIERGVHGRSGSREQVELGSTGKEGERQSESERHDYGEDHGPCGRCAGALRDVRWICPVSCSPTTMGGSEDGEANSNGDGKIFETAIGHECEGSRSDEQSQLASSLHRELLRHFLYWQRKSKNSNKTRLFTGTWYQVLVA